MKNVVINVLNKYPNAIVSFTSMKHGKLETVYLYVA